MMGKGSGSTWGNKIGYFLLPLRIASLDNPLDYIQKAKTALNRKKESLEAQCVYSMADSMPKIFGTKV